MIRFEHVSCGYRQEMILRDINLTLPDHKITTIIGQNGCGKSTLLKAIVGLSDVSDGRILVDEAELQKISRKQLAQRTAYFSQQHSCPSLSVERLVLHGRFPYVSYPRSYRENDYLRCEEAMRQADVYEFRQKNVRTLSGGERQKVYLAMCLCQDAEYYLFDEPTTYLDIRYQLELQQVMIALKNAGKTVVTILHDLNAAMNLSDQIIAMDSGKVAAMDTPEHIYEAGVIDRIFQVHTKRIWTEEGAYLYYF